VSILTRKVHPIRMRKALIENLKNLNLICHIKLAPLSLLVSDSITKILNESVPFQSNGESLKTNSPSRMFQQLSPTETFPFGNKS